MENQKSFYTIRTYQTMINKLQREFFNNKPLTPDSLIKYRTDIIKYITKLKSLNTQHTLLLSVINYLKENNTTHADYYTSLLNIKNKIRIKNNNELVNPSKKDTDRYIPIEKIFELKEKYRHALLPEFSLNDIKFIMLSLYSNNDLPPLRSQDYYNCKIANDITEMNNDINKSSHNYILLTEKLFVRNTGKTFKNHGQRFIEIPDQLITDIKNFQQKSNSQWLIPSPVNVNNHIEQAHFSKLLTRTLKSEF